MTEQEAYQEHIRYFTKKQGADSQQKTVRALFYVGAFLVSVTQ